LATGTTFSISFFEELHSHDHVLPDAMTTEVASTDEVFGFAIACGESAFKALERLRFPLRHEVVHSEENPVWSVGAHVITQKAHETRLGELVQTIDV
jgi:hypothetical protein